MIANGLTGLRLVLVAPTAWAFAHPESWPAWWLLALLLIAIATDMIDGMVARRSGTASPAGQLFDHGTDCLFVTAALAGAAYAGGVPWLLPPLVALAFGQYVVDSRWLHRERRLRGSLIGRWNGIFYFLPLLILAAARLETLVEVAPTLAAAAYWLAWLLVASTLISMIDRAVAPWRRMA